MAAPIITVQNLSKRYLVGHQSQARSRYTALRDVIAREVHNFTRKAVDLLHGRQIIQGDEVEEFWALRDVNFEVQPGEVIGIIGRNGAGKSTLLKILGRITEPTEGRVLLGGRVASLLEVGTGFHPELTGRENIFLNGAILGMTQREIRQKFDEIVAFAEVEKFLDTPVKRYSSGMYVRLAFAVAAHLEPEILIVDEVLAVGDLEFQRKCLGKMSDVARGGRTILFVSHNHSAVRNLCTHAILMREGRATPKYDVPTALELYASQSGTAMGADWTRPAGMKKPAARFETIDVRLTGSQPNLRLLCNMLLTVEAEARPSLIAVDIADPGFAVIMQAEPSPEPFIRPGLGQLRMDLAIELPPLVPGTYSLDFWIGPHNTETYDYIRRAVTIQVTEAPSSGRTFPYTADHGFIVPKSTVTIHAAAPENALT